jgi:hypothetical protein
MAYITKAFDLFYKRIGPTGSYTIDPYIYSGSIVENWYSSSSAGISSSFLNFPKDYGAEIISTYATTRNTTTNAKFRALPWASHACDMLWNVTVPSWSFVDISSDQIQARTLYETNVTDRTWTVNMQTSKSFYRHALSGGTTKGVAAYSVTSSWTMVDSKLLTGSYGSGSASFHYVHATSSLTVYPVFIGSRVDAIRTDESNQIAYDITYPTIANNSTSSFDGQYFDLGGGAGITRTNISRSLMIQKVSGSSTLAAGITACTRALKNRRLFFPTPYSGSGTTLGTDYWFKENTGYNVSSVFNENGGIYNIQLTLKRSLPINDCYPDDNSFLSIFIHNVNANIPIPALRVAGASGWYPPDNNIIKIGNAYGDSPAMTFSDIQTGYLIEKFSFNVIQYGFPAQLCIEASGSLADDKYFGIIVDDIQICKIGVTTDPRFTKSTTISQTTSDRREIYTGPPNEDISID